VDVNTVAPELSNLRRVNFRVLDVESDPVFVTAHFQLEGEQRWRAVEMSGGQSRVGPLPSSPGGVEGAFDWDVERIPSDARPVVLRLLVSEVPSRVSIVQHVAPYLKQVDPIIPRRPLASVDVTALQFESVTLGDTTSVGFQVENRGNEVLIISSVILPSSEMTLTPSLPIEIEPGVSAQLGVVLAPTLHHDADGALLIQSNDPINPAVTLAVDAEILALSFSSELLPAQEEMPLGEAATIIVQPAANVRLERGVALHRVKGDATFQSLPLTPTNAGFSATIPGKDISERGLEYYVEMENSGIIATDPPGAPANIFTQTVASPMYLEVSAIPNSGSDFAEFTDIDVLALVKEGTEVTVGSLFYRPGGAHGFGSVSISGSVPVLSASIPGDAVTDRGVEYWIEIETATTVLTDPSTSPSTAPRTIQVTVSNLQEAVEHPGQRYRMLSIPLRFADAFDGQISDLLELGPTNPTEWRLYRYLGLNIELSPDLGEIFRPEPGRAFWLITRSRHRVDTAPVVGLSTPTHGPYRVPLDPGWNQVGNPFNFPVSWESVVRSDDISEPAAFDGRGQYADATLLLPFEGYFVYNASAQTETLCVPPVEATEQMRTTVTMSGIPGTDSDEIMSTDAWSLALRARTPSAEDMTTKLGVHAQARDRFDPSDRLKPPSPPGTWVRLGIDHDDWEHRAGMYRLDYRSPGTDGNQWDLVLRSQAMGEEVTIAGWADAEFPDALRLRLVDLEQGVMLDLRDGKSDHQLLSFGPDRDYRLALFAGTADYVSREVEALTEIPTAVVLDQNAPNPFNPSTRLRFGLPKPGLVSLTIYNIRGQRVATLLDRESLPAGFHTLIWNGQDQRGHPASSGVYLYQLVTEEETIAKKMALMQ
jgi:hypothetical protein